MNKKRIIIFLIVYFLSIPLCWLTIRRAFLVEWKNINPGYEAAISCFIPFYNTSIVIIYNIYMIDSFDNNASYFFNIKSRK